MGKLIILFYFILNCYLYGTNMVGNGGPVFFYVNDLKTISYVRKSPFDTISISQITPMIVLDGEKIIDLKDNLIKVSRVENKNILKFQYKLNNENIYIYFYPSLIEKKMIYMIADMKEITYNGRIDLIYQIIPQHDNRFAKIDDNSKYVSYDDIFFVTDNYTNELYLTRNGDIQGKLTEKVTSSIKKYQQDNLYYIIENIKKNKSVNSAIIFEKPKINSMQVSSTLQKEDFILKKYYSGKHDNFVLESNLNSLKFFTSTDKIPNEISLNVAHERSRIRTKLLYMSAIFGDNLNGKRLIDDVATRRDNIENVELFIHILEYYLSGKGQVDIKTLNTYLFPQILSLCDSVTENGAILNGRDYSEDYYLYYKLFNIASQIREFSGEKNYIIEKRDMIKKYLLKNYYISSQGEFKDRIIEKSSNYKNIDRIDIFSKNEQTKILKKNYSKYYDEKSGLLKKSSENYIDMSYNLKFIIKLYENSMYTEGDYLVKNLNKKIKECNYRIIPQIYGNKDNSMGVYGDLIYLYLKGVYIRGDRSVYKK
ncbi:hypothetical protein [Fusobacterium sp. PH5-44]|uniref:hypothetical protein n=1 Tax=unclassified Fusobacterium TaxID=2648384 RepID=UPI003D21C63F